MMRITELKQYLVKTYYNAVKNEIEPTSRLILGMPGIGKTEIGIQTMKEIAEKTGKKPVIYRDSITDTENKIFYVYLNLNEVDSIDLTGLPRENNGYVVYKPLKWARICAENPCFIHLDEITSVKDDRVLSSAMKIICERMVGYEKLSRETMIIATGNTPETNSMASDLPAPFINKVAMHIVDSPTIEEWGQYMNTVYGDRWDKRALAFLGKFPEYLATNPESADTLKPYATPRSWTRLAVEMYLTKQENEEIINGYIGSKIGNAFYTFLKMRIDPEKYYNNPELLKDADISTRYLVASYVATRDIGANKYIEIYNVDEETAMLIIALMPKQRIRKLVLELLKDSSKRKIIENIVELGKLRGEVGNWIVQK